MLLQVSYSALWQAIIRPPREVYTEEDLGPRLFMLPQLMVIFQRRDFDVVGPRGSLKASFFALHES